MRTNVQKVQQAQNELKQAGDFVLWENPEFPGQIQITLNRYVIIPETYTTFTSKLITETIYCDKVDVTKHFKDNLAELTQYIRERLITLVEFDVDWTLSIFHSAYEKSLLEGNKHSRNLRFPEHTAAVIEAIAAKNEYCVGLSTMHTVSEPVNEIANALLGESARDEVLSFIRCATGKIEPMQEFSMSTPGVKNGKLIIDPSRRDRIGTIGFILVNDDADQNQQVKMQLGDTLSVVQVNNVGCFINKDGKQEKRGGNNTVEDNQHLIELNNQLSLGLTIPYTALKNKELNPANYESPGMRRQKMCSSLTRSFAALTVAGQESDSEDLPPSTTATSCANLWNSFARPPTPYSDDEETPKAEGTCRASSLHGSQEEGLRRSGTTPVSTK